MTTQRDHLDRLDHLDERQLAAAVAGLELDQAAEEHLGSCLSCRRQVSAMSELIDRRRAELEAETPDWEAQRQSVLQRLPATGVVVPFERRWLRPALALAATVVVAVGVAVLQLGHVGSGPSADGVAVEEIVAEVEATFDGYGFEVPAYEEILEEMDESLDYDIWAASGLAPLGELVPGVDDIESLFAEAS